MKKIGLIIFCIPCKHATDQSYRGTHFTLWLTYLHTAPDCWNPCINLHVVCACLSHLCNRLFRLQAYQVKNVWTGTRPRTSHIRCKHYQLSALATISFYQQLMLYKRVPSVSQTSDICVWESILCPNGYSIGHGFEYNHWHGDCYDTIFICWEHQSS